LQPIVFRLLTAFDTFSRVSRTYPEIAAYRQLQHDTTGQLYSVTATLALPLEQVDARVIEAALRQLKQFGYDLDRLHYVARDEATLLSRIQEEYNRCIQVLSRLCLWTRGSVVPEKMEKAL
jgi:hypothetical protein